MEAFEKLRFYQNICTIRKEIYKITERFAKSHLKLVSQMRDAIRSAKQNIREGYKRDSLNEFIHYIKISRASLSELEGDADDCYEDKLISDREYKYLKSLITETHYQIGRYMDSLFKMQKLGTWKQRWPATKSNRLGNLPVSNRISRGAALIIALMVITAVSGFAFFASRLTISEIASMNKLEDSMVSFYASEAGIEQGLLMQRYNHEAEFSKTCTTASNCSDHPTEASGDPRDFVLGAIKGIDIKYYLKIWHRNNAGLPETGTLSSDQTIEYDTTGLAGSLSITCTSGCTSGSDSLEYSTFTTTGVSGKDLIISNSPTVSFTTSNDVKLRLRSWGSTPKQYTITSNNSLDKLDSKYTNLDSRGAAGATNRKMNISINRLSGSVLSLADFVLFGSGGVSTEGCTGSEGNDSYTKLLLHMDGTDGGKTFTDSSASAHVVFLQGNAQTSTAQKKFGTASALLTDITQDHLAFGDSSDWHLGGGTGNFTIDMWVRFSSFESPTQGLQWLIGQTSDGNNGWALRYEKNNPKLRFASYDTSGGTVYKIDITCPWTPVVDTWYHVAVVRNGPTSSDHYIFINGISQGLTLEGGTWNGNIADFSAGLRVGGIGGEWFTGYEDEVRISNMARWTSNFTPPAAAYGSCSTGSRGGYGPNVTSTAYTIHGGNEYPGQGADRAFDKADSYMSLYQPPIPWIGQDFGSTKNIRQVRIYSTSSFEFNTVLQYSDNGIIWNDTNVIIEYPHDTHVWREYNVDNYGQHRYWRFLQNQFGAPDNNYLQINEIEMKEAL